MYLLYRDSCETSFLFPIYSFLCQFLCVQCVVLSLPYDIVHLNVEEVFGADFAPVQLVLVKEVANPPVAHVIVALYNNIQL